MAPARRWRQRPRDGSRRVSSLGQVHLLGLFGLALLVAAGIAHFGRYFEEPSCRATYLNPEYLPVSPRNGSLSALALKYRYFLVKDRLYTRSTRLEGAPVLFVHGHAGSYKQLAGFSAETAHLWWMHGMGGFQPEQSGVLQPFDLFTVDFCEEFSAFDGATLLHLAYYLNEVLADILEAYRAAESDGAYTLSPPTSVAVVCHSMGGIVVRLATMLPNHVPGSVQIVHTLASPHERPPAEHERLMHAVYAAANAFWRDPAVPQLRNVSLVSIAGGRLDFMVPGALSDTSSLLPPTHGLTAFTTAIPSVWTPCDHKSILWCNQLMRTIALLLYDGADFKRQDRVLDLSSRMRRYQRRLVARRADVADELLGLGLLGETAVAVKRNTSRQAETPPVSGRVEKLDDWRVSAPSAQHTTLQLWTNVQPAAVYLCGDDLAKCLDLQPWLVPVPAHESSRGLFRNVENASWALSVDDWQRLLREAQLDRWHGIPTLYFEPAAGQPFRGDPGMRGLGRFAVNPFFDRTAPLEPFFHAAFYLPRPAASSYCGGVFGCSVSIPHARIIEPVVLRGVRFLEYAYALQLEQRFGTAGKTWPDYGVLLQAAWPSSDSKAFTFALSNATVARRATHSLSVTAFGHPPYPRVRLPIRTRNVTHADGTLLPLYLFTDPHANASVSMTLRLDGLATLGFVLRHSRALLLVWCLLVLLYGGIELTADPRPSRGTARHQRLDARLVHFYPRMWVLVTLLVVTVLALQLQLPTIAAVVFAPLLVSMSVAAVLVLDLLVTRAVPHVVASALGGIAAPERALAFWQNASVPVFAALFIAIRFLPVEVPAHVVGVYAVLWQLGTCALAILRRAAGGSSGKGSTMAASVPIAQYLLLSLAFAAAFDVPGLIVWVQNMRQGWDARATRSLDYGPMLGFVQRDSLFTLYDLGPVAALTAEPIAQRFARAVRPRALCRLSSAAFKRIRPFRWLPRTLRVAWPSTRIAAVSAIFAVAASVHCLYQGNLHLYLVHEYLQLWCLWLGCIFGLAAIADSR